MQPMKAIIELCVGSFHIGGRSQGAYILRRTFTFIAKLNSHIKRWCLSVHLNDKFALKIRLQYIARMGVEECLDCGGVVADTAETCPHCGSRANYEKRNKPSAEEMARIKAAEKEAKLKTNIGCGVLIAIVIILSVILGLTSGGEDREYSPSEKLEMIEKYG